MVVLEMNYEKYLDIVRKEWRKNKNKTLSGKVCTKCNNEFKREGNVSLRLPPDYNGNCPRCGGRLKSSSCSF